MSGIENDKNFYRLIMLRVYILLIYIDINLLRYYLVDKLILESKKLIWFIQILIYKNSTQFFFFFFIAFYYHL